ncbi:MAG: hypothetical protein NTV79_05760, partial [Candidatus Aureabacteria bacterium]|nr:hypothetical protein [Candidatus Auribacterota bacterium]
LLFRLLFLWEGHLAPIQLKSVFAPPIRVFLRPLYQPLPDRIVVTVENDFPESQFGSDAVLVISILPDIPSFHLPPGDSFGRVAFKRMHDLFQGPTRTQPDDNMDMIGHDHGAETFPAMIVGQPLDRPENDLAIRFLKE